MTGRVTLAGAGPGDPDLLTVKALRAIAAADVILHDSLVGPGILALARPETLRRETGKRCGRRSTAQDEINRLMLHHARAGAHVVRLKGGDPMLFGRADEEVEVLRQHRIPYEVIPGVTAASAAAAALGVSLTRRRAVRSVHFLTGHGAEDGLPAHAWRSLARLGGTLVVYMGRATAGELAAQLIEAGMAQATPAIAVENASLPHERSVHATLASLPQALAGTGEGPVLILIGAALRHDAAAVLAEARGHVPAAA